MEATIRDICGDFALDLDMGYGTITLYFNSRQNALNVKRILEVDGSCPNQATVCDMQEVVRCEDCLLGHDYFLGGRNIQCECNGQLYHPDHYCSYGDRKSGTEQ